MVKLGRGRGTAIGKGEGTQQRNRSEIRDGEMVDE